MCRVLPYLIIVALVASGCGDDDGKGRAPRARPLIATTFLPMTFITQELVGDAADVVCPVPPDADPSHWTPTREGMARFQDADLVIYNGVRFEAWMQSASLPR